MKRVKKRETRKIGNLKRKIKKITQKQIIMKRSCQLNFNLKMRKENKITITKNKIFLKQERPIWIKLEFLQD
jgi:hypothetical protein